MSAESSAKKKRVRYSFATDEETLAALQALANANRRSRVKQLEHMIISEAIRAGVFTFRGAKPALISRQKD
jgi:hypothetical protein